MVSRLLLEFVKQFCRKVINKERSSFCKWALLQLLLNALTHYNFSTLGAFKRIHFGKCNKYRNRKVIIVFIYKFIRGMVLQPPRIELEFLKTKTKMWCLSTLRIKKFRNLIEVLSFPKINIVITKWSPLNCNGESIHNIHYYQWTDNSFNWFNELETERLDVKSTRTYLLYSS